MELVALCSIYLILFSWKERLAQVLILNGRDFSRLEYSPCQYLALQSSATSRNALLGPGKLEKCSTPKGEA